MLNVTTKFRNAVAQNSKVQAKATLALANGATVYLTGDDFMMSTMTFEQAVSSTSGFDVGGAIVGSCSMQLNNYGGKFDDYDFTGATVTPYVGVDYTGDGAVDEWLRKGRYWVDQPDTYGTVISLDCEDALSRFSSKLSAVGITQTHCSVADVARRICAHEGVTLVTTDFNGGDLEIAAMPTDDMTTLDAMSYLAQMSCNFVRCTDTGAVEFLWYGSGDSDVLDDGSFTRANVGAVDAGSFKAANADAYDAGTFARLNQDTANTLFVHALSAMSVCTDDVVITGVSVKAQDGEGATADGGTETLEGETATQGTDDYMLSIEGNPFILYGQAATVAAHLGRTLIGMRFRPFEVSAVGDPAAEAGDSIVITDRKGLRYFSYVTSLTWKVGNYATYRNSAQTPARHSALSASAATKAYQKALNEIEKEKTARELAYEDLVYKLGNSSGLHVTKEEDETGGIIYYLHSKPLLEESAIVWKMTAEAIAVSTNYNEGEAKRTWNMGITASGDEILNRLYALQVDAKLLTTGKIEAQADPSSNYWDLENGNVKITDANGNGLTYIDGELSITGGSIAGGELVASTEVQYCLKDGNGNIKGAWSAERPLTWGEGYELWQRTAYTYLDGETRYSPSEAGFKFSDMETVFNELTNNGASEGLYIEDGKLYVNASYINSGVLCVKDADGTVLFEANLGDSKVTLGCFNVKYDGVNGYYMASGERWNSEDSPDFSGSNKNPGMMMGNNRYIIFGANGNAVKMTNDMTIDGSASTPTFSLTGSGVSASAFPVSSQEYTNPDGGASSMSGVLKLYSTKDVVMNTGDWHVTEAATVETSPPVLHTGQAADEKVVTALEAASTSSTSADKVTLTRKTRAAKWVKGLLVKLESAVSEKITMTFAKESFYKTAKVPANSFLTSASLPSNALGGSYSNGTLTLSTIALTTKQNTSAVSVEGDKVGAFVGVTAEGGAE